MHAAHELVDIVGVAGRGDDLLLQIVPRKTFAIEGERQHLCSRDLPPLECLRKLGIPFQKHLGEHGDPLELILADVAFRGLETPHDVGHHEQVEVVGQRLEREPGHPGTVDFSRDPEGEALRVAVFIGIFFIGIDRFVVVGSLGLSVLFRRPDAGPLLGRRDLPDKPPERNARWLAVDERVGRH